MRSLKDTTTFFNKMKKKPKLQKIIDNIDNYSITDIEKVAEPKWIRDELKKMKKKQNTNSELLASLMIQKSPQPKNLNLQVYRYIGPNKYVTNVEILTNELVVMIDNNIIKFNNVEREIHNFNLNEFEFVKKISNIIEYVDMYNHDINTRISCIETESNVLNKPLFTIRRIE